MARGLVREASGRGPPRFPASALTGFTEFAWHPQGAGGWKVATNIGEAHWLRCLLLAILGNG
jgi:hypothetical protein